MAAHNNDYEMYIQQNYTFAKLPAQVKQALGNSKREWDKVVVDYSLAHQLRWKRSIVRKIVLEEEKYYHDLLLHSKQHLMLYPYHLSDIMVVGLKCTPFRYYYDIFTDMLKNERSYDSLPNFAAADALRFLGIGRNQYIDLMNSMRSKGFFKKKANPKNLLPPKPVPAKISWWWEVSIGYVTDEDIKACSPEEHQLIDRIIDRGPTVAGVLDKRVVHALYERDLISLGVPISDNTCVIVPPLEGFVMNRVLGDYFENLLYKIFVSIDEHTTVEELANVLRIDKELVKDAVSMYCRLGFAKKKGFDYVPPGGDWHPSWREGTPAEAEAAAKVNLLDSPLGDSALDASGKGRKRIGFLFDSSLTAILMMGNLSANLKTHAVTMFEAGKLSDESLDSFLIELSKIETLSEGDAQFYFSSAQILLESLKFLRRNKKLSCLEQEDEENGLALDLLRCESLSSLDSATCHRVLKRNYAFLVSMTPLTKDVRSVVSSWPPHVGPAIPEVTSIWFRLYLYELCKCGPPSVLFAAGTRVRTVPKIFHNYHTVMMYTWAVDSTEIPVAGLLPSLNDLLCHSAVLVQGYRIRKDHTQLFHVPFPMVPGATVEGVNAEWLAECHAIFAHPMIKKLRDALGLDACCGYITVLKNEQADWFKHDSAWTIVDLNFGLPLMNADVNRVVCHAIQTLGLFSEKSLRKLVETQRQIVLSMMDFIASHQDLPIKVDPNQPGSKQQTPLPTRSILCVQGILRPLDPLSD
eukprot:m.167681 g.167681  ORF g.167681 m.167681 type:complete len:749 (+) comp17200_c0_seq1:325-2571(+)